MSLGKNKKTVIHIGATTPATADLAAAVVAADTSFMCLIESMDGLEFTRGTITDPTVYCTGNDDFQKDDTDDLKISAFTITGLVNDDAAAGYLAVKALADQMIIDDTQGTMVITEPGGEQLWFEIKFTKVGKGRGAAQDKQKFMIDAIARTMPKDA